ncbi:MAG: ATP-dependent helicase, partial [Chitinophagales bacterium]
MNQLLKHEDTFAKAYATLNERQREAVDCIEGPVLVVAGPGTGKTQILAVRIGTILSRTDTLPENILCLTYTDAGTVAMRRRLASFIGPDAYRVGIYTFHAFCNEVIQSNPDYFGRRELEPVSDLEKVTIVENILHKLPANHILKKFTGDFSNDTSRLLGLFETMKKENWEPATIHQAIDTYLNDIPNREEFKYQRPNKSKGIALGDLKLELIKAETEKMERLRAASALFDDYQEQLRIAGRYDYADMILWVLRAFATDENLLRNYQERYLYFLVDEFQDTNGAQNEILQQLTSFWDVPNVFAVGDDDQSIYEFQGARVKNILDFYNRYSPDIKLVVLTDNYRSTQSILDASKAVIDKNNERLINKLKGLSKNLQAKDAERVAHNYMPEVHQYKNIAQEEAGVMHQIEELNKSGVPLNEIAVLYHRHAQADNLIRLC